jgi:hypothetical protein
MQEIRSFIFCWCTYLRFDCIDTSSRYIFTRTQYIFTDSYTGSRYIYTG